jgi:hypothetical protein
MTVIRRPGIASVAALAGIIAALVVAQAVAPGWARAAGLDVWNLPAVEAEYRAASDHLDDLRATHDHLQRQVGASDQVVGLLIDGRLPLAAAAEELALINRGRTGFYEALRVRHPEAASDQELAAWYALEKAVRWLAADPARRAAVSARLDAELRAMTAPEGRNDECPPMTHQ